MARLSADLAHGTVGESLVPRSLSDSCDFNYIHAAVTMVRPLRRLPRLFERAAFLGLVCFTMLLAVGSARAPWTAEGSSEETVHSAHERASVLRLAAAGGDADDDRAADALPSLRVLAGVVYLATSDGVVANDTYAPVSAARQLPGARGPPRRA